MNKILLDTNTYSSFVGGDEKVMAILETADQIYISVFVLAELFGGFRSGEQENRNRKILEKILEKPSVSVLEASRETAEYYGLIKASLRKSGRPLPTNDIWIAAHALETGALLVTYDAHFKEIPGLRIWDEI